MEPVSRLGRIAFLVYWTAATAAAEDNAHYYQQGGVTYRETSAAVNQPANDVQYRDLRQTRYSDRYTTEMRNVVRSNYVPVTRYVWQPRWHGQWNIFQGPHLAYHLVPQTSWEVRQQTVQVPTTRRVIVPESRTVRVPQTNLRSEDRVQVTRVPIGPAAPHFGAGTTQTSMTGRQDQRVEPREVYGGVARLDGDPPRHGIAPKSGNWTRE